MQKQSFIAFRLRQDHGKKSFVRAVCDGKNAENLGADCPNVLHPTSRRHRLPRLPPHYEWTIGEPVVLVTLTGAGMVPTGLYGTFQGFVSNGRKRAQVAWARDDSLVSSTVAIQRIRPITFIPQ